MSEGGSPLEPRGDLATRDLPTLIHELHREAWTGSLALARGEERIGINVRQGQLVFASSSNPDHRLGPLLLRRGKVSLRQVTDAGEAVGPGKRLGTILVERNLLSMKELVRAVVDQTQEIVYHAFQWTEGSYELKAGAESSESITLSISTPNIILEGVRRIESWSRILRGVGGLTIRYARAPDWETMAHEMYLSNDQRALLDRLATPCDVESLCESTTLSDFEACRTLWAFLVIGVVRRADVPPPEPSVDDEGLAYIVSGG
jgi:hypothetical protein